MSSYEGIETERGNWNLRIETTLQRSGASDLEDHQIRFRDADQEYSPRSLLRYTTGGPDALYHWRQSRNYCSFLLPLIFPPQRFRSPLLPGVDFVLELLPLRTGEHELSKVICQEPSRKQSYPIPFLIWSRIMTCEERERDYSS